MSRPLLFQKRGKRTLVVASRYNNIKDSIAENSTKASSKKYLSSKENISPESFKVKNQKVKKFNNLSSLTYKFANLELDMNSDSDCELIDINSTDKSQKVTSDFSPMNLSTTNNEFRRPSPKRELPNEKICNPQRSFRKPSPKSNNRFLDFRRSSSGSSIEQSDLGSIETLPSLDNSKFRRQSYKSVLSERSLKYTQTSPSLNHNSRSRRFTTSRNVKASSPQLVDLTKDSPETTSKKYTNKFRVPSPIRVPSPTKEKYTNVFRVPSPTKEKYTNGFRVPSPTKEKYTNGFRVPSPTKEKYNNGFRAPSPTKEKYNNGFRAPSPTKGKYINLPKLDLLSDEGTPEPSDMRKNREGSTDIKKKCPYCNEPLPDPLPPRIRAYLESPSKMPSLSLNTGLSSNIVDQFEFCRLHDAESHIVPDGLQKNYPLVIDFDSLPNRIEVLFPELLDVTTGKTKSRFRDLAMDAYNELGKARARKPTVVMGRFQKFLPGYYGSKGSSVIFSTLVSLFVESKRLTINMTKPQEPLEYLNQVLVPETAIRLIAQDRGGITLDEAREVMEDSMEFGMYVHDVEEEDI